MYIRAANALASLLICTFVEVLVLAESVKFRLCCLTMKIRTKLNPDFGPVYLNSECSGEFAHLCMLTISFMVKTHQILDLRSLII